MDVARVAVAAAAAEATSGGTTAHRGHQRNPMLCPLHMPEMDLPSTVAINYHSLKAVHCNRCFVTLVY